METNNLEEQYLNDLKNKFIEINKQKGDYDFNDNRTWFKSHRNGSTGIGKTFEDLLGKKEDNLQLPDYKGIELKAHDTSTNSLITLFTKSPNLPRGAASILREEYGYSDDAIGIKVLHTTVPSNKLQFNEKSKHYFKIIDNPENKTVDLEVYDINQKLITDNITAKWSYAVIQKALDKKLKNLAIVLTNSKKYENHVYYNYYAIVYTHITVQAVQKALSDGTLLVDLRLGAYKSGPNKGKNHDHGTGFRISFNDLMKYAHMQEVVNLIDY